MTLCRRGMALVGTGVRQGHVRNELAGRSRAWRLLSGLGRRHLRQVRARRDHPARRTAGQPPPPAAGRQNRFPHGCESLQTFDAVAQNIPTIAIAAMFQKDPQVLIAHPDRASTSSPTLRRLTLFVSSEGLVTYFQWLKADFGFDREQGQTLHIQPAAIPGGQEQRHAGLRHVRALRHRAGIASSRQCISARRSGLQRLLDPDRDAPRHWSRRSPTWCSVLSMPRSSAGIVIFTATTGPPTR